VLKLLIIIGGIYLLYRFIKGDLITKPAKKETKDVVECCSCGLFVAQDEALRSGSSYYCSTECKSKGC